MGGFSIAVCALCWMLSDKSSPVLTISQLAFSLAFVMNHPHFLSSYMLMYGDFKKSLFKKPRYFFAGVIAPAVLGGLLITAMIQQNGALMGHIINGMFFLVGWHYVKQVFGCVIVTSAQRKIYYKSFERRILLANLFCAWFMSWLKSHVGPASFNFYGITHYSLNLPAWTLQTDYYLVAITGMAVAWMHVQKYIREGVKPSPPGVMAFAALYVWYLPVMAHPGFSYLIPFFHSMQYLAFVWKMKKNQVAYDIRKFEGSQWRSEWVKEFGGFMAGAVILGAVFFEFLPKNLDSYGWIPSSAGLGSAPFLAAFLLFINIHHYFIDNAIWKSDNEVVKKFLFQASATPQDASELKAA